MVFCMLSLVSRVAVFRLTISRKNTPGTWNVDDSREEIDGGDISLRYFLLIHQSVQSYRCASFNDLPLDGLWVEGVLSTRRCCLL